MRGSRRKSPGLRAEWEEPRGSVKAPDLSWLEPHESRTPSVCARRMLLRAAACRPCWTSLEQIPSRPGLSGLTRRWWAGFCLRGYLEFVVSVASVRYSAS